MRNGFPSTDALFESIDATWPAAKYFENDGWLIREGRSGGKRVSAASILKSDSKIIDAEKAMVSLGQSKLFMIRDGEVNLDVALESKGYLIIDPVVVMVAKTHDLASEDIASHNLHPSEQQTTIWKAGGIGSARLEVMKRAKAPKSFSQIDDKATAFSCIYDGICMTHAVEVDKHARRQGFGHKMMRSCASWAQEQGAQFLSVLTVVENKAAENLYSKLGFKKVCKYHYRIKD